MELLRRRIMMGEDGPLPEWDYEWDYTMGSPVNNGLVRTISGTAANIVESMTEEGWRIEVNDTSSYINYTLPSRVAKPPIGEIEIVYKGKFSAARDNFLVCFCNASDRCVIYTNGGKYTYSGKSAYAVNAGTFGDETWHSLKFVLHTNGFNGYSGDANAENWLCLFRDYPKTYGTIRSNGTCIEFRKAGSGSYLILKSIRIRYNRYNTELHPSLVPSVGENCVEFFGTLYGQGSGLYEFYDYNGGTRITFMYNTYANIMGPIEHVDGAEYEYSMTNKYYGTVFFSEDMSRRNNSSKYDGTISYLAHSGKTGTLTSANIPSDTKYIVFAYRYAASSDRAYFRRTK